MSAEKISTRTNVLTWGTLLGLTLLTSLLGLVDLGVATILLAILIAAVKASLIAVFFMRVLRGTMLTRVCAAVGVLWFLIMVTLTLADYQTRGWLLPAVRGW